MSTTLGDSKPLFRFKASVPIVFQQMLLGIWLYKWFWIYCCIFSLSSSQNGFLTTNQLKMLDRGNHCNVYSKLEFPFGRILGRPCGMEIITTSLHQVKSTAEIAIQVLSEVTFWRWWESTIYASPNSRWYIMICWQLIDNGWWLPNKTWDAPTWNSTRKPEPFLNEFNHVVISHHTTSLKFGWRENCRRHQPTCWTCLFKVSRRIHQLSTPDFEEPIFGLGAYATPTRADVCGVEERSQRVVTSFNESFTGDDWGGMYACALVATWQTGILLIEAGTYEVVWGM